MHERSPCRDHGRRHAQIACSVWLSTAGIPERPCTSFRATVDRVPLIPYTSAHSFSSHTHVCSAGGLARLAVQVVRTQAASGSEVAARALPPPHTYVRTLAHVHTPIRGTARSAYAGSLSLKVLLKRLKNYQQTALLRFGYMALSKMRLLRRNRGLPPAAALRAAKRRCAARLAPLRGARGPAAVRGGNFLKTEKPTFPHMHSRQRAKSAP